MCVRRTMNELTKRSIYIWLKRESSSRAVLPSPRALFYFGPPIVEELDFPTCTKFQIIQISMLHHMMLRSNTQGPPPPLSRESDPHPVVSLNVPGWAPLPHLPVPSRHSTALNSRPDLTLPATVVVHRGQTEKISSVVSSSLLDVVHPSASLALSPEAPKILPPFPLLIVLRTLRHRHDLHRNSHYSIIA